MRIKLIKCNSKKAIGEIVYLKIFFAAKFEAYISIVNIVSHMIRLL